MKKAIHIFISILSIALISLLLASCSVLDGGQIMRVTDDDICTMYKGTIVIDIWVKNDEQVKETDSVTILAEKEDIYGGGPHVLSGHFEKYTYAHGKLFVLYDDIYHECDVDDFTYPTNWNGNSLEELGNYYRQYYYCTYTPEEFVNAYPDQESFGWEYSWDSKGYIK